jgi:predicted RNA binding protein YcfA (HicA-like mRNA interferase family)
MKQLGWEHARTNGSHETWICGSGVMTLATHSNDLKPYQIKAAQKHVLGDEK